MDIPPKPDMAINQNEGSVEIKEGDFDEASKNLDRIIDQVSNDVFGPDFNMDEKTYSQYALSKLLEVFCFSQSLARLRKNRASFHEEDKKNLRLLLQTTDGKPNLNPGESDEIVAEINHRKYESYINKLVPIIRGDLNDGKKGPNPQVYINGKVIKL